MKTILLPAIVLLLAGCGGPPQGDLFEVNQEATFEFASKSNFKMCQVVSDRICESPDGKVVFHMPMDVILARDGRAVADDILISNESTEDIVVQEYYIAVTDDKGNFYRAEFFGPGGYHDESDKSPALVLSPDQEEEIRFVQRVKPEATKIVAISIFYRLKSEPEMTQVVVSYRPHNIRQID